MTALLVALGGAFGTLLRYAVNLACSKHLELAFPIATFSVNALGSCALGLLSQVLVGRTLWGVPLGLIVGTGVLGGFTTYSSFNLETLQLVQRGQPGTAALYVALTLVTCFALGALGVFIGARMR